MNKNNASTNGTTKDELMFELTQRLGSAIFTKPGTSAGFSREAEFLRKLKERIEALQAEVQSLQGFADLWYFAMDHAPGDFQRIVTTHEPSQWMYEIAKIRRGER